MISAMTMRPIAGLLADFRPVSNRGYGRRVQRVEKSRQAVRCSPRQNPAPAIPGRGGGFENGASERSKKTMRKLARKWAFTASMVADAPDTAGVYALWDGDELLYIGHADGGDDTLRSRLAAHLVRPPAHGRAPSHYSWEICRDARTRVLEARAELGGSGHSRAGQEAAA